MTSLPVFLVSSLGAPRNHHAIFVETNREASGSGTIFQVTGNIQEGMRFEEKPSAKPENSLEFIDKQLIGRVPEPELARFGQLCRGYPPPKKQFDGPRRLYPDEPLIRCQEWTSTVIAKLRDEGLL